MSLANLTSLLILTVVLVSVTSANILFDAVEVEDKPGLIGELVREKRLGQGPLLGGSVRRWAPLSAGQGPLLGGSVRRWAPLSAGQGPLLGGSVRRWAPLSAGQGPLLGGSVRRWAPLSAGQGPLLGGSVRRWAPLSAAVKNMVVPMSLISAQKIQTGSQQKSPGFSWQSCGPSNQLVEIRNLSITPSPLIFPGQLSFGFDIVFHDTIAYGSNVSANLQLQYSSRGDVWVTIPCVGQIGSCTYDDVCSMSQSIPCPDPLKQMRIPCTCPFNKGEYILPSFDVEVDASLFIAGYYRGKATFTDSKKGQIACYQATFTVG